MLFPSSIPALDLLAHRDDAVADTATHTGSHSVTYTRRVSLESVAPILREAADGIDEDAEQDTGTSYARCADGHGTLSSLFFSEDDHDIARARAICRPCGLRASCLEGAIERLEPYGVWGGKLVIDGVPVDVRPKRGRPPKNPRPVVEVEEVPIPAHLVA